MSWDFNKKLGKARTLKIHLPRHIGKAGNSWELKIYLS
jgi:hypothetical protein